MKSLRVLVVTVVHDPEDARIRYRQIGALNAAGHQVTFAAPFRAYGRECPPDIECVDLPRAQGRRRAAAARAARRLVRERGRGFDVVVLHDPELLGTLIPTPVGRVVWDVHEDTGASLSMKAWLPRPARPAVRLLVRAIERWVERRVPLILAEESYALRFRRPHPVVPNSVLPPKRDVPPPGDHRVVYLGRLTAQRGALEMIELGRRLAPTVAVELIGNADADCETAIEAANAAGHIRWLGFMPNDAALDAVQGALAGLSLLHDQPNYAHSRPTKIMEYMAHGIPVVTTPNPSSADLVRKHECGLVVPFGDLAAAQAAVTRLRDDPGLRKRLASNGRAAAAQHYSWAQDASRFVRILEDWSAARS
jgi:glycosyltransferase involved in cell wall biosynthesis